MVEVKQKGVAENEHIQFIVVVHLGMPNSCPGTHILNRATPQRFGSSNATPQNMISISINLVQNKGTNQTAVIHMISPNKITVHD